MKKIYFLLAGLLGFAQFVSAQEYTPGNGDGLKGSYWKGATNFDQEEPEIFWSKRPQGTVATKEFERIDPTIDFEWGNGNPFDDTDEDFAYCIEWNGYLLAPVNSTYTFDFTHWDDGHSFELYDLSDLENPLVTSEFWGTDFGWDRPEWTCDVDLEEGKFYKIRIKYYEHEFGAHAKFAWFIHETALETVTVPQSQLYSEHTSAVEELSDSNVKVLTHVGQIEVKNLNGENLDIFDLAGRCVFSSGNLYGSQTVELNSGMYIVKVGALVKKVIVL